MNIEIAEIIQKFSNILILDASISEEEFKIDHFSLIKTELVYEN